MFRNIEIQRFSEPRTEFFSLILGGWAFNDLWRKSPWNGQGLRG
jgi:hypothetical protein